MAETFSFSADNPAVHTQVGERVNGTIRIAASSGCGLYGPYIDLPPGPAVVRLTFEGNKRGRVSVDCAINSGSEILAKQHFQLELLDDDFLQIPVLIPPEASKCEVRLYCLSEVNATLTLLEILANDWAAVEQLIRHDLGDEKRGVIKGRDVTAGYARSRWVGFQSTFITYDPDWQAAMAATQGRSIVTPTKLMNIFLIMKYSMHTLGNIIEFGSYRGGSALFMAALAKRLKKPWKVFALDTFEGMPPTDRDLDRHPAGVFADVDLPGLERARSEAGLDNLLLLKGFFEDTVDSIPHHERHFFLSHIDCDVYPSMVFSIEYSKKHAAEGSYIVLDDPLTWDCLGAMQATEELLVQEGVHAEQAYPHLVYRYPPLASA